MKRPLLIKLLALCLVGLMLLPLASCVTKLPEDTLGPNTPITNAPETEVPPVEPTKTAVELYIDSIDAQVTSILNTASSVTYTGTAYYVAADGDDNADGLTPETAWQSISKLNQFTFAEGDAVLFKRGDKFRTAEAVYTQKGVTYSAYGEGEKPMLICSVDASDWTAWEGTEWPNIYKCTIPFDSYHDVGNIIFDGGEAWGIKVTRKVNGDRAEHGHVSNGREHFDAATGPAGRNGGLSNNLEFFHDHLNETLYLYCAYGLPDEVFESIEICDRGAGFTTGSCEDIMIDNIAVYGAGSFGVGYNNNGNVYLGLYDQVKNVTVQNCAFYYNGGAVWMHAETTDYPTLYTNPVAALDAGPMDFNVKNCYSVQLKYGCSECSTEKGTVIGTDTVFMNAGINPDDCTDWQFVNDDTSLHVACLGYADEGKKVLITPNADQDVIHLYADDRQQEIIGFGGSHLYWLTNGMADMSDAEFERLMDIIYDPEEGLGLSVIRLMIGYCFNMPGSTNPEEGVWNYDFDAKQIKCMQRVMAYDPNMTVIASPWTPPGWMKNNNSDFGSFIQRPNLLPEHYEDYADYLVRWVKMYNDAGVPIHYLSVQNEPTVNLDDSGTCVYTAEELAAVTKIINRRFKEENLDTVIMIDEGATAPESAAFLKYYELYDPEFLAEQTVLCTHAYQYQGTIMNTVRLEKYGLPLIQSERCVTTHTTSNEPTPKTLHMLMRYGNELVDYLEHGYAAYLYWGTYQNFGQMGYIFGYDPAREGKDAIETTMEYCVFGQIAKFMRPGHYRIASDSLNSHLAVTASVDPDTGKTVLVVVNNSASDITVTVDGLSAATSAQLWRSSENEEIVNIGEIAIENGSASITFKGQSITTVVEQ